MGTATRITSTRNQATTNYDFASLFTGTFQQETGNVAASGDDVTVTFGQILGRVAATGKLAISKSAGTDGSEIPVGVCLVTQTIADGENADIPIATTGMVNEDKLVFDGTDDLDTEVTSQNRVFRDLIPSTTEGIKLRSINELAETDNQ